MFSVEDSGIGIPEEKLSSIFESFTQASNDTTRKYGGTGLGLTIAKQLVEIQGGIIGVKSILNRGSEFYFTLPCKKNIEGFEVEKKEIKSDSVKKLTGLKVLLVEDNVMNQILATKVLEKWECEVDVADNGRIAVAIFEKSNFDIILMDMQMPEMDGYETARYIRQKMSPPKSGIPIIAMTAHAFSEEIDKCKNAGMDDYISKPFNQNDLYEKIATLVMDTMRIISSEPVELEKYCDLTYLKEISEGNRDFEIKMINTFNRDVPSMINEVGAALKDKNYDQVRAIAHKMRPSIDFMGISSLKGVLKDLEKFAAEKVNLDKLPRMFEQVKNTCEKAGIELKKMIE